MSGLDVIVGLDDVFRNLKHLRREAVTARPPLALHAQRTCQNHLFRPAATLRIQFFQNSFFSNTEMSVGASKPAQISFWNVPGNMCQR
jgi:hypothetical protein